MNKYRQNYKNTPKKANKYKNRQKSRKNPPKVLVIIPFILSGLYLYLVGLEYLGYKLMLAAIFILFYEAILLIAWAIHYRRMLGGATQKQIDNMTGEEFEDYLSLLYKNHKADGKPMFLDVKTTPKTCDYGADLLFRTLDGRKVVVQAKRYRNNVPEAAVQQLIAAREFYKCDVGMVITNSTFTDAAKTLAKRCDVILIDRFKLGTKAMYKI